jgi:transposase InsO family protein
MRAGLCAIVRRATLAAMSPRRVEYGRRLARPIVLADGRRLETHKDAADLLVNGVGSVNARSNAHWFMSLADASKKMEDWRRYYNEERPHGGIGQKAPITMLNHDGAASPPP